MKTEQSLDNALNYLHTEPIMGQLIDQVGKDIQPIEPKENVYQELVKSIMYQQLAGKAADTIFQRFLKYYQGHFPLPEELIVTDLEELRSVGLSRQKGTYIKEVAQAFMDASFYECAWDKMEEKDVVKKLTSIKGVGVWTAQMILMFTLGFEDILPTGDYGVQTPMKHFYEIEGKGKQLEKQMLEVASPWKPHRTVASLVLWRSNDLIMKKK